MNELLTDETEADKTARNAKIAEARSRQKQALVACQILAFDGSDAQPYQEKLKEGLKEQLTRCTVCVREFHRGRSELKQSLEEDYDEGQVGEFLRRFDQMNIERITAGLDSAKERLLVTEPTQRSLAALDKAEMYALFEAMFCGTFLKDEELLSQHFDEPFRLVQTRKKISLSEYSPALTAFVFSRDQFRREWALRGWNKIKRKLTGTVFDCSVKDTLEEAVSRMNITNLDGNLQPIFWSSFRAILEKLDKGLITHHLRALGTNIYPLALDHLQFDNGFTDLVVCIRLLLEKSPEDFWDGFGTVSPQTVVEQIFTSLPFERMMTMTDEEDVLDIILSWIDPLVESIKPANIAPACRSLLQGLMTRFQEEKYSRYASIVCWKKGLRVMNRVLQRMSQTSTSGATVSDMLEVAHGHILDILKDLQKFKGQAAYAEETDLGLEVIQSALALDCSSLAADRETITQRKPLGHDVGISSLQIWKATIRGVYRGEPRLPAKIMSGTRKLLTLEPFPSKQVAALGKTAELWNNALQRISRYVIELLDQLQDFESSDLQDIFKSQESAESFFALLFSGDDQIQQAAATVLRNMSSESSRRAGVKNVLETAYTISLLSISKILRTLARTKVFTPCRAVLKVGMDIISCLCDSSDGILRSKTLTAEETRATEHAWEALWISISTMFESTESWSNTGFDKAMLMDFCRDTMDFADQAFDQYSVIAGALRVAETSSGASEGLEKRLLENPRLAAGHGTKWLRLRDEYLIQKAVSFTCRIMDRLRDAEIELPEDSTLFVEDVALGGKIKTKLTAGQKAELRQALEKHLGHEVTQSPEPDTQRPHKQGSLSSWVTAGATPGTSTSTTKPKKSGIDFDAWRNAPQRKDVDSDGELRRTIASASPTLEMLKARGDFQTSRSSIGPATKKAAQNHKVDANDFRRKRMLEQEEKKRRDAAIIAAAKKNIGGAGAVGAGSGLKGLGVDGKDHSVPKGQGVMVSSDEESEDDEEDDIDAELFGGTTKPAKRQDKAARDAAGAVGIRREARGPVKLQRQIRSAKDMRARLAPDLTPLHKAILSWEFFHDGDYPPKANEWEFKQVASSFRHVGDYQATFQPLLLLEAWQGFVRCREENNNRPYEIRIVNRSSVDAFIELSSSMSHDDNRKVQIGEGDIVLFSRSDKPTESQDVPHCLARVYRIKRQKQHLEILYRVMPGGTMMSSLTPGGSIFGTKLQSITPLEREYGALLGLQYYDLCDEIIKARPSPLLTYTDKQLDPLINNYTVNRAQAKAIRSAVDNDAFTLIQGPPGSGKTKTIVAIVGALLSDTLSSNQIGTRIEPPKPGAFQSVTAASKKLLVCAPSNAAVDELVMRFKEGVKTTKGVHKKINVVRLGRSDAINTNVVDVTMDELVNQRLGTSNGDNKARERTTAIMKEHQAVSEQVRHARERMDSGEVKGEERSKLQDEFNALRRRKTELGAQIDVAKDAETAANRTADINRKRVQQAILDEAHVICATLSGSGHEMFQSLNIEFETVVVDEAAQCVEMSALIPLKYGCAKCILVGDPKQLPPTVFSKEAARFQYEQSLFVRMQGNFPDAVHLLDTQYRMHPDISSFPSATFYDGRLLDGNDMAALRERPWHTSSLLAPYRFFDVQGQHSAAPKGHSLVNYAEIEVAMSLYERLLKDYDSYDFNSKIGIITPYKSQLSELKTRFSNRYGRSVLETVEFNTTDAFQGRESEVIIFSCVRASPAGGIGFLQDIRRMNVGLTRAKSSLWVLGNSQSLMRGQFWNKLVVDAKARDCYTSGDLMGMLRKPSSNFPAAKKKPIVKQMAKQPTTGIDKGLTNNDRSMSATSNSSGRSIPSVKQEIKPELAIKTEVTEDTPTPMEGIRVKLEDKIKSIRSPSATGSNRSSPSLKLEQQDVEMADAASDPRSGTATPLRDDRSMTDSKARSETPVSGEDRKQKSVAPRPATANPPPAAVPRKRKPTGPFMPANRSKQARR